MQNTIRDTPGLVGGMTCGQAAVHLGLSRSTIRRQVHLGRLVAKKTPGGHMRFDVTELERLAVTLSWGR